MSRHVFFFFLIDRPPRDTSPLPLRAALPFWGQRPARAGLPPRLRVVAGLQGFCGPDVAELLPRLAPALRSVSDELVILDLGAALAHAGQESPRRTAEAIAEASQRAFIVMHDSPARLVKQIQVLQAAQLPQEEL